jgi:hypothetical protein
MVKTVEKPTQQPINSPTARSPKVSVEDRCPPIMLDRCFGSPNRILVGVSRFIGLCTDTLKRLKRT